MVIIQQKQKQEQWIGLNMIEDFREYLQENYPSKYDGVILDEGSDSADAHRGLAYVPFYPNQIKSATDNIGTYDLNNPDIRFSIAEEEKSPVLKVDWNKEGKPKEEDYETETIDPDSPILYEELEEKRKEALKDTLNALSYNGQRYDDIAGEEEWQEMSEDERIEWIEGSYDDWANDIWREVNENEEVAKSFAEKQYEKDYNLWGKQQLLIHARDMAKSYAESLGYTIIEEDENSSGTSYYLKVNNGEDDMTLRFSDHEQPDEKWNKERVTYMRDGKQYTAYNDVEAVIEDFELDLAPIWEFLQEYAPNKSNEDIRFLKEYNPDEPFQSDSDRERMITVLMGVDKNLLRDWDYTTAKEYLESKFFDLNDNTAQSVLNTARTRQRQEIHKGSVRKLQRERQIYAMEAYPFYRIATELFGDDLKGKIVPTERQKGIEMSGSFIHPWFKHTPEWQKKHAADRPKGNTDEIAQRASNELGRDVDENEIIEFFNGFTIAQINSDYSKLKATQREEDAYFTRIAQEEWESQENNRIQSEVERIMEATYEAEEIPISREWADQNQDKKNGASDQIRTGDTICASKLWRRAQARANQSPAEVRSKALKIHFE